MIVVRPRTQRNYSGGDDRNGCSTTQDVHAVPAEQIRAIPERQAFVLANPGPPNPG